MTEIQDRFKEELEQLRTLRDELRVQLHLGSSEVKERWEKAERAWEHAEGRLKVLGEQAGESAHEVSEALKLVLDEIREGYQHLRNLI